MRIIFLLTKKKRLKRRYLIRSIIVQMNGKERNKGLDILKFFCISLIILLHTQALKESFPISIVPICRFAVPIFFMITGFFYDDVVKRGKEVKQIKKTLFLIFFVNIILFLLNIIYGHL